MLDDVSLASLKEFVGLVFLPIVDYGNILYLIHLILKKYFNFATILVVSHHKEQNI